MRDALVRHMQFYNTCPQFEAIVVGIVAALEVKNVESGNTMGPTIEAVKTSLMGPTGVIGDAFFQTGGFRIISASIGASMCIAGNPFGLLLYFLIYNVPNYLVHWWGIHQGFKMGSVFIEKVVNSGVLQKIYRFMSNCRTQCGWSVDECLCVVVYTITDQLWKGAYHYSGAV